MNDQLCAVSVRAAGPLRLATQQGSFPLAERKQVRAISLQAMPRLGIADRTVKPTGICDQLPPQLSRTPNSDAARLPASLKPDGSRDREAGSAPLRGVDACSALALRPNRRKRYRLDRSWLI